MIACFPLVSSRHTMLSPSPDENSRTSIANHESDRRITRRRGACQACRSRKVRCMMRLQKLLARDISECETYTKLIKVTEESRVYTARQVPNETQSGNWGNFDSLCLLVTSLANGLHMLLPGASAPTAQDGVPWPHASGGPTSSMHTGGCQQQLAPVRGWHACFADVTSGLCSDWLRRRYPWL